MQAIEHAMRDKNVPGQFSLFDRYGAKVLNTLTIRYRVSNCWIVQSWTDYRSVGTAEFLSRYRRLLTTINADVIVDIDARMKIIPSDIIIACPSCARLWKQLPFQLLSALIPPSFAGEIICWRTDVKAVATLRKYATEAVFFFQIIDPR